MKRTDKIGVYLKLSCSALLLSGSLVGYGFTKDVFADSQSQSSNVENTSDSQTIAERVKQAKDDIKNLQALSDSDIKSFGERLDKAKDQSSIDDIIKDAKDKNNQLKDNQSKSSSSNDDNTKELDKLLDDLDLIAKNVDTHQQKAIIHQAHNLTIEIGIMLKKIVRVMRNKMTVLATILLLLKIQVRQL